MNHTGRLYDYVIIDDPLAELPDPPENPDFNELFTPAEQDEIERRFSAGIALHEQALYDARQREHERQREYQARVERRRKAQEARRTRERANKASLGERAGTREALSEAYLAAHRADNSGSER